MKRALDIAAVEQLLAHHDELDYELLLRNMAAYDTVENDLFVPLFDVIASEDDDLSHLSNRLLCMASYKLHLALLLQDDVFPLFLSDSHENIQVSHIVNDLYRLHFIDTIEPVSLFNNNKLATTFRQHDGQLLLPFTVIMQLIDFFIHSDTINFAISDLLFWIREPKNQQYDCDTKELLLGVEKDNVCNHVVQEVLATLSNEKRIDKIAFNTIVTGLVSHA